jgi:hypothetical protein
VLGRRTETRQVFANPDGTWTAAVAARPVRVHRADGSWVPVDTTLRREPGGWVAPVATPMALRLSGGGAGPLVTMTWQGRSLALSWPGRLPAPVLAGDTATYPAVRPGVDLQVRSTVDGFSDVLVVRTASAGTALSGVRFGLRTAGVTAALGRSGELSAVDSGGRRVFAAPPALMWDSAAAGGRAAAAAARLGGAAASTSRAPGAGAHRARLAVRLSAGAVQVRPDRHLLATARYPVYVDPETTYDVAAWTEVNAYRPGSVWRTDDNRPAAGHSYDAFGTYTVRSFFDFDTSALVGAHIYSATFRAFLAHSWSCQARPVELWAMPSGFSAGTTWNTQPSWAGATWQSTLNVAKGYPGCPAGLLQFPATKGVAGTVAAGRPAIALGLKASNESDVYGWKKFDIGTPQTVPQLDVTYDFAPNPLAAKDLSTDRPGTSCTSSVDNAPHVSVPSTGMVLKAHATDPDGRQNVLRVNFEWYGPDGVRMGGRPSIDMAPGSTFSAQLPRSALVVDGRYTWRANVQDVDSNGHVMSTTAWSPWCAFVQDSTEPNAPVITSGDYPGGEPVDGSAEGLGRSATFAFDPNGSTDVVKYVWSLDQDRGMSGTAVPVAAGEPTQITITPNKPGINKLFVLSVDAAGLHQHQSAEWVFDVPWAAAAPVGVWHLDDGPGSTVAIDSSGNGDDATPTGGVEFTTGGRIGGAAHFDGSTGTMSTPLTVGGGQGLTVSAWVRLDDTATSMTAVSGVNIMNPSFALGYRADTHHFVFDSAGGSVQSAAMAQPGVWTLLTGVYDPGGRRTTILVNGQASALAVAASGVNTSGAVHLGCRRARGPGLSSHCEAYWHGDIDEVQVWDRVAFPTEIALMAQWSLDGTGHDDSAFGHDVTPAAAAGWGADRFGTPSASLALTGGSTSYAATTGPVLRTDASYTVSAWVRLTSKAAGATVVGAFGGRNCGFYLQYRPDIDRWAVAVPNADTDSATLVWAAAGSSPSVGVWVHLVASYDATVHTLRLYVGTDASVPVLAQEIAYTPTWNASGPVDLGRAVWHGGLTNLLTGGVDDVQVYGDVLTDYEINQLS